VDKDYRHGIGWNLMRRLSEKFPLVLAIDGKDYALRMLDRLGWVVERRVPRYLAVLDAGSSLSVADDHIDAERLREIEILPGDRPGAGLTFLDGNAGQYAPDWGHYPAMGYGTVRSSDFLLRRYRDHPVFEHFIAVRGNADRPSVCVFRLQHAYGPGEARLARILEFFHPGDARGRENGEALMGDVLAHLRGQGCAYADFVCSSRTYGQTLRATGWVEEPAGRHILPARVCPVDHTYRATNFVYYSGGDGKVPLGDIYITGGDGDADRSAMAPGMMAEVQPGITIRR
jgi:hypothetical protein